MVGVAAVALLSRVAPDILPTTQDPASNGRLAFPLTYWNALGVFCAVGGGAVPAPGRERRAPRDPRPGRRRRCPCRGPRCSSPTRAAAWAWPPSGIVALRRARAASRPRVGPGRRRARRRRVAMKVAYDDTLLSTAEPHDGAAAIHQGHRLALVVIAAGAAWPRSALRARAAARWTAGSRARDFDRPPSRRPAQHSRAGRPWSSRLRWRSRSADRASISSNRVERVRQPAERAVGNADPQPSRRARRTRAASSYGRSPGTRSRPTRSTAPVPRRSRSAGIRTATRSATSSTRTRSTSRRSATSASSASCASCCSCSARSSGWRPGGAVAIGRSTPPCSARASRGRCTRGSTGTGRCRPRRCGSPRSAGSRSGGPGWRAERSPVAASSRCCVLVVGARGRRRRACSRRSCSPRRCG